MKIKEISNKNRAELAKLLSEKREALREFSFGSSGSKVKNVKAAKAAKKDVARILTTLNALKIANQ